MKKSMLATVILLAFCVMSHATDVKDSERTITVSGTATIQTVPDMIVWSISTLDESRNLVEAKDSSDRKLKSIMALINELGVKPEEVQTGYLNINREYNQDSNGRRLDFKGFSVRRGITITQRDLKRFDEYLTKLVTSAEMEVSFRFDTSRMTALRWDTRLKALEIAKEKAEAMTKIVNGKVGKVLRIEEPPPVDHRFGSPYTNNIALDNSMGQTDHPADIAEGTFAPGSMEIKMTVVAVFEIE